MSSSRRDFFKTAGGLSLIPALVKVSLPTQALATTAQSKGQNMQGGKGSPFHKGGFTPLPYSDGDRLDVSPGFESYVLLKKGDIINNKGDKAGDCCDFNYFIPGESPDHGYLWTNYEYVVSHLLWGKKTHSSNKTKAQVDKERSLVGGGLCEIKRNPKTKRWEVISKSTKGFRIDGTTPIPMVGAAGGRSVTGTMGNCSGGFTAWQTILTCEENVEDYYHSTDPDWDFGWHRYYKDTLPTDYGWVVEVNIQKKKARKLTALGRFAHEGATLYARRGKRAVVYMGDDKKAECLYKFVSKDKVSGVATQDKDLLLEGTLYVANLRKQRWEALTPSHPKIKKSKNSKIKTLKGILENTREAAKEVGGTPLNRPEDIEINPLTGDVILALTNNSRVGDYHGSLLVLKEEGRNYEGLKFDAETFCTGGTQIGFACPDNIVFGPKGYLWVATDISGSLMGKGPHKEFQRNSLLRIEEDQYGNKYARHFLQAPTDAEVTGAIFSKDEKSLFVSIQHPGEYSYRNAPGLTSHWPGGGQSTPLSAVVVVDEKTERFDS